MRTYIYIDGFNFYYGAVRNTPYKWLDFKVFLQHLLDPNHQILSIKYFTSLVSGKLDPEQPLRQKTYLRAIQKHIPELSIYYGHFLTNKKFAPLACQHHENIFVPIIKTEEKGSDVKLAIHLLNDAWLDKYDCAIVVSNDSDLAESCKLVKEQHKKVIGLLNPTTRHPSKELMKYTNFIKRIRKGVLKNSQLPDPIPGTTIRKPSAW